MQRYYAGENIINCRDLGGYVCDGGVTKYGIALRAGVMRDPDEKDLANLEKFGVKTIIDLRGIEEAECMPSYFKDNSDYSYYHYPLLEANPAMAKSKAPMSDLYMDCLKNYSENVAAVMKLIASLDEPFMFHCFCGKDRTGMVSALLLSAAGVCKEDIIADYEVSYTYIKPFIHREIENKSGLIWEGSYERFYSYGENMEIILDFIDKEFGGVVGYLRRIGLSEQEIEALRCKLV
ncbi:MAG: tyrosine-protein phosphatase [Clostridia bacterium]|nr:tyrosine-protein phosphatase [Clostridia bacterium]